MHLASNRTGPGMISRATTGVTQARRLSYYTVRHSSSSLLPYAQKQAGTSAEANRLVIVIFRLSFFLLYSIWNRRQYLEGMGLTGPVRDSEFCPKAFSQWK